MRNNDYQFVETDAESIESTLTAAYEALSNTSVKPGSPEGLFIKWVAQIIVQERVINNYTGNQNLPSRAEGENLDALAELFYLQERPAAKPASATERFNISAAQSSAVLIPSGTRVTDASSTHYWATSSDAYIAPGSLYADVVVTCLDVGEETNGYAIGQLNKIVDVYDYFSSCSNTTASDGGSDEATDDEFYELLRASMDGFSTAGAKGGYIYNAKKVSTTISDVVANTPSAGEVRIYAITEDNTTNKHSIASAAMKALILSAVNADLIRPLTDHVAVSDPTTITYNINFTYYIPTGASSIEITAAVTQAVNEYVSWQSAKLGRDINPSKLIGLLMQAGVKRVNLTSPTYTALSDGSSNTAPEMALIGTITATNGGFEDE